MADDQAKPSKNKNPPPTRKCKRLVFQHFPKAGGTSLHKLLEAHFGSGNTHPARRNDLLLYRPSTLRDYTLFSGHYDACSVDRVPSPKTIVTILRDPRKRILSLYNYWRSYRVDFAIRHNLKGPIIANKSNLEQFLSHRSPFVRNHICNIYARWLTGPAIPQALYPLKTSREELVSLAKDRLESMDAVGILEKMKESIHLILSTAGAPTPATIPHENQLNRSLEPYRKEINEAIVSPQCESLLCELTELDREIYDYAQTLLASRIGSTLGL